MAVTLSIINKAEPVKTPITRTGKQKKSISSNQSSSCPTAVLLFKKKTAKKLPKNIEKEQNKLHTNLEKSENRKQLRQNS